MIPQNRAPNFNHLYYFHVVASEGSLSQGIGAVGTGEHRSGGVRLLPLGVVLNSLILLEQELQIAGEIAPRAQMLLDRLRRSTALMGRMTNDLLELGRTYFGPMSVRKEAVDLVKVTDDVMSSLSESEMKRLLVRAPAGVDDPPADRQP
jgi:hypothetical protein